MSTNMTDATNQKKRRFSQLLQEQDDADFIDLSGSLSPPKPKKQKSNPEYTQFIDLSISPDKSPKAEADADTFRSDSLPKISEHSSDSVQFLSITAPNQQDEKSVSLKKENKENVGDSNNSEHIDTNIDIDMEEIDECKEDHWLNDEDCIITDDRLQSNRYEFRAQQKSNPSIFIWLKHEQLLHLNIYNQYVKENEFDEADLTEEQYVPEAIIDHQHNEEMDEVEFFIKWLGYDHQYNSWEPHSSLKNNVLYIAYCKKHKIPIPDAPFSNSDQDEDENDDDDEFELNEEELDDYHDEFADFEPNQSSTTILSDGAEAKKKSIDIHSEYMVAQKKQKQFEVAEIQKILISVDEHMQIALEGMCDNENNNNHNKNGSKGIDIQLEIDKLMDIRECFERLKEEALTQQFLKREVSESIFDQEQYEENNGDADIEIMEPEPIQISQTPKVKKQKRRVTLFDYAFTPSRNKQKLIFVPGPNTTSKVNKKSAPRRSRKDKEPVSDFSIEYVADGDEEKENLENIKLHTICYGCSRKWNLYSLEFFKKFPFCNDCPKNWRLGHNRKFREDWFCPWCCHTAHCVLFPIMRGEQSVTNDDFGTNGCTLQQICDLDDDIYLYVKPNASLKWKTYSVQSVVDEASGTLMVRDEHRKRDIVKITLSEIDSKHILWAKYEPVQQLHRNDIKKVLQINRNGSVKVVLAKNNQEVTLERDRMINLRAYFEKICLETFKKSNARRMNIKIDRSKIFKWSHQLKGQKEKAKRAKDLFGQNTKIIESAPMNSRFFNQAHDVNEEDDTIPTHPETIKQLLSHFNLESVPENMLKPPQRNLSLSDIEQYSLVLIVGESGSGKSTLLKSLQAQNPTRITFKDPQQLTWDNRKCVISQFGQISIDAAMKLNLYF